MLHPIRVSRIPLLLLCILCSVPLLGASAFSVGTQKPLGNIYDNENQAPLPPKPKTPHTLPDLLHALDVLQSSYFAVWEGIWPRSIDWTSAVIGTYLCAALTSLSTSFPSFSTDKTAENTINKYFSQLTASYFGQDAFALRQEAYDDMLWVVLGWLEGIKFIDGHSKRHYGVEGEKGVGGKWYGEQWIPAFAHRARIFWDMASQGWDTELCDGGMIWSPYLLPYKNAITNELYIAASIEMYLYFPGDPNTSPFGFSGPKDLDKPGFAHDPKYLAAAVEGYKWLVDSNMTDSSGLYVDGFHISDWSPEHSKNRSGNTRCDARNEMVYTYNQGVLLTGQKGLYQATGARSYLQDGHKLVQDVIAATGWDLKHGRAFDDDLWKGKGKLGKWHGLGRSGILEEACDAPGYCSQDAQTFKGIFFHHLTSFCSSLPDHLILPDSLFLIKSKSSKWNGGENEDALKEVREWHDKHCKTYSGWIKHNAKAALKTRDTDGRFGMWWGAPLNGGRVPDMDVELPDEAVDYRNLGVPKQWKEKNGRERREENGGWEWNGEGDLGVGVRDLNDRGRGRTVETQGGGVAVLRAAWEVGGK